MSNSNADIVLAGAAAAFTIDLLIYPLDTIKTRYQSQDFLKTYARSGAARQASPFALRGLYQGVGSVIVATLPAAGIFFTTYEATKTFYTGLLKNISFFPDGFTVPTPLIHSLASGTAELASCLVLTPAEVIKQNAQMIRSSSSTSPSGGSGSSSSSSSSSSATRAVIRGRWKDSTSVQALRMISQGGGAAGAAHRLLTGYTALVARNLPFTAIQFPLFEAIRQRLWERRTTMTTTTTVRDDDNGAAAGAAAGGGGGEERRIEKGAVTRGLLETGLVNGMSAAVSGAIAAVITTPTDVVKTRMMLSAGKEEEEEEEKREKKEKKKTAAAAAETPRQQQKRRSGMQVARRIYQERGIQGLFRGGLLRAGWTALGSGLYLGTYEVAKVWLKGTADVEDGL